MRSAHKNNRNKNTSQNISTDANNKDKQTLELIVSFLGEDFQKFKDEKLNTK